jgi:hypothetical protein
LVGKLEGEKLLENLDIDGSIILEWILESFERCGQDFSGSV